MKKNSIRRPARFAAVSAATVVVGAALASAGFAGLRALDLGPAAAQQYPKKVTICHRTHSKKHPWVKIRVSRNALKAHFRHGDFVVDATHPCPPTGASANAKHKHKHKNNHQSGGKKHKGAAAKPHGHGSGGGNHGNGGGNHGNGGGNHGNGNSGKHGKK